MLPSLKPFLSVKWDHWLLFLYSQSSHSCIINCTYIFLVNINFISSCFVTLYTQNYLIISCFQGKIQKLIVKGLPHPQSPSNLFVKKIHSSIHPSIYPFSKTLWNTCAVLSHVWLCAPPWTVARQAPLSMEILQAIVLEWVAMPSSRGSSPPRDQTQVSPIIGGFFTVWATRDAQEYWSG